MKTRIALLACLGVSLVWASYGLAADIQKGRQVSDLLQRIRDGKDTMPAFRGLLRDEEIRDVITYLRTF